VFALHPDEGWTKLGATIDGENIGDWAGRSIALSAGGTDIAIGSLHSDNNTGHVRIYRYNTENQRWGQRGSTIRGETAEDFSGVPVVISRDGSVVAIGAWRNDGNGSNSGHVRVFESDDQGSNWVQRGSDIDGEASGEWSGYSVDLSADGSVVVVGAPLNDGNGIASGNVRIFKYKADDVDWVKYGNSIDGKSGGDLSGGSVAMSADGTAIAIGAKFNDGNGNDLGHLRVYDFDSNGQLWVQRGKDIYGKATDDQSGRVVSMSADASVVGINGFNTNALRIFQWAFCTTPPSIAPELNLDCAYGESPLRLDLVTDRFPKQTTWQVINLQNEIVFNGGPYDKLFTAYQEAQCLVKEGCYEFTIQDSASDGICCNWFSGNGRYKLHFDSTLVQEGDNFSEQESSILFGDTCPSPIPSLIPSSKPTTHPTTSMQPSEFPTKLPSNQPSNPPTESLEPSSVPSNSPTKACSAGSFANFTTRACQSCPPGTYQNTATYADKCINCEVGTYQPDKGGKICIQCERGTFQPIVGQTQCLQCRAGGYCASEQFGTCEGGFKPCRVGTYNNKTGQDDETACVPCPIGTYADGKEGLVQCLQCPFRLSSLGGESNCSFCAPQFYLAPTLILQEKLFTLPDAYCKACPPNTNCPINTTVETLQVEKGFWRDSSLSSTLYPCANEEVCTGSSSENRQNENTQMPALNFCLTDHTGPLCEVCMNRTSYFNPSEGKCTECPPLSRIGVAAGIMAAIAIFITITHAVGSEHTLYCHILRKISMIILNWNLQGKIKLIISFFQIFSILEPVYGVLMHSRFTSWLQVFKIFSLNMFGWVAVPKKCLGSMTSRLIISSSWPFGVLIILVPGLFLHTIVLRRSDFQRNEAGSKFLSRTLYATIVILYIALPSVSSSIFEAIQCKSFKSNDEEAESKSYLISDWSLRCDESDKLFVSQKKTFWIVFAIWPVAVPLFFIILLLSVQKSLRAHHRTRLAEACRFLWRDYKDSLLWWDFIDIIRKIFLSGLIVFIDSEAGSDKILRLIVATAICVLYISVLGLAKPYNNNSDLYLAFTTNIVLLYCFLLGIILQFCGEEDEGENTTCEMFISPSMNAYKASLVAVVIIASMLICLIGFLVILTVSVMTAPTIRLARSNMTPNLEIPEDCKFHFFLSHVWTTGQDKAHKIAKMIQILLPGLKIWLDVDELQFMAQLEKSVGDSAIFLLFYSEGYFRSLNCRREVYSAVCQNKPIIVVYEGNWVEVEKNIIAECRSHCTTSPGVDVITSHLFAEPPILWLGSSMYDFYMESVKLIVSKILCHFPYYKKYPNQLTSLKIGTELDPIGVTSPLLILYCSNQGARDIAEELAGECEGLVSTRSAENELTNSSMSTRSPGIKLVLLVYLNQNTFAGQNGGVSDMIKQAYDNNIQLVLIHEQDENRDGCPFSQIFSTTPQDLMNRPYLLYKQSLAIPLYTLNAYRIVSLHQILRKMGARHENNIMMQRHSNVNIIQGTFARIQERLNTLKHGIRQAINWIRDNLHALVFLSPAN